MAVAPPHEGGSVTYVSGTMCYLCLSPLTTRDLTRYYDFDASSVEGHEQMRSR